MRPALASLTGCCSAARARHTLLRAPAAGTSGMAQPAPGSIRTPNSFEDYAVGQDQRIFAPAASRNKQHICDVLLRYLQALPAATVLEVACGTGEHTAHFASALPRARLLPTDHAPELFGSVAAHARGLANVSAPQLLDASAPSSWDAVAGGGAALDAIVCINMTHISPREATLGLLDGAGRYLAPGSGLLFIYGPFTVDGGRHTSDSNREFDASLRARNPTWGYWDTNDVAAQASARGLETVEVVGMPANNFTLVFRRK